MPIVTYTITVDTTGSAGSATGTATSELIMGELIDIYLNYHGNAPNTTDTTISMANGNILVSSNSATDALVAPRLKCVDNAGAAITNSYERFLINGTVSITLAQCDALSGALVATLRVLRMS